MNNLEELFPARVLEEELSRRYARVRARTVQLAAPLSEEDCCVQSMPDASPVKWHLAHTTWFFETFVLKHYQQNFKPFHDAFGVMFNSYYNGIGGRHPRPQRGMLTRPRLAEIHAYRRDVDQRMQELLQVRGDDAELRTLVVLGINHEQQHQELILTDVKHLLSLNPLLPSYYAVQSRHSTAIDAIKWIDFDEGMVEIGYGGNGFCFDNETPRYRQYLQPYGLASRLVTNGEYMEFVEERGYKNPEYWLSEGWDWLQAHRLSAP